MVTADFIDYECKITQESFELYPLSSTREPAFLAHDLQFLVGYYEDRSKALAGSQLEPMIRHKYEQTLTNLLVIFRRETTNDLGGDPRAWIKKYGN